MDPQAGLLGFLWPGGSEFVVILVIGLLLYGRNLPQVGRVVGRTVYQLRRQFEDFKRELAADESVRDARSHLHDLKSTVQSAQSSVRDLRRNVEAPARLADPRHLFDDLTDTSRSTAAESAPDPSQGERAAGDNGKSKPV